MEFHGEQLNVTASNNNSTTVTELAPNAAVNANSQFNSSFGNRAVLKEINIYDKTKLSPVPTKALPTKLTPAGAVARTNLNTTGTTTASNATSANSNNMEINSTLSQSCMDSILATHTFNSGADQNINTSLNKSASKFMGLPEFDESTIPELPDSLNPNLEEQLKLSFEDGLIPTFTANVDTAMNTNVNNLNTIQPQNDTAYSAELAEAESSYKSAMHSQNFTAVADAIVAAESQADSNIICVNSQNMAHETLTEIKSTNPVDRETMKPLAGDITFEDEAMDIDISITESEEEQLLSDKTHHVVKEEEVKENAVNVGNVMLNMNFVNEPIVELTETHDKEPLTFALSANETEANKMEKSQNEQQLFEAALDKIIELPTQTNNVVADQNGTIKDKPTDLSFSSVVMQVTKDLMDTRKRSTTPSPAAEAINTLNLTLDMTSSFCSAKSSAPASPTFPITPHKIPTEFPRSPTSKSVNKNYFLEKSEYAESLQKEKTPLASTKSIEDKKVISMTHQPIATNANAISQPGSLNNTFNGTTSEAVHDAADRRRTFNVGGETTPDKFPAAIASKLNQSDVNKRRTFNLSDVAEQQQNETIEAMDVDVSMTMPTSTPIGLTLVLPVEAAEDLNKKQTTHTAVSIIEGIKIIPPSPEKSEQQPIPNDANTTFDNVPLCWSSPETEVLNGTTNKNIEHGASGKRRTFNVAEAPAFNVFPTAPSAKLNQSDVDRRRTFNLSNVAEQQQQLNETIETIGAAASMTMPTSTPIGLKSTHSSPCELPVMVEPVDANGAEPFRSNSPPLPTHQAKRQAIVMDEYAVPDASSNLKARSISPPLPAQQSKLQTDEVLEEYGAATEIAESPPNSTQAAEYAVGTLKLPTKTTLLPGYESFTTQKQQTELNRSYSVPSPNIQQHEITPETGACAPPLPRTMHKQPRQSILTAVQDFQQQPLASLSLPAAIKQRPSIHAKPRTADDNLFRSPLPFDDMLLSAKEISKDKLKDEKDIFVEQYHQTAKLDDMFAVPMTTNPNKFPFGGCSSNSVSAGNHFDFQQHQQQQQFEAEFCNQSSNVIFDPSDFDYLLSKGNNNVQVDRSSLLLRFDPLLGVPVPVNQTQEQQQQQQLQLQQILANNNNNNQFLSPTVEEEDEDYQLHHLQQPQQQNRNDNNSSFIVNHNKHIALTTTTTTTVTITTTTATTTTTKATPTAIPATLTPVLVAAAVAAPAAAFEAADLVKRKQEKKDASMSVDIIKDMNIDNDCNKTFENSNKQSEDKQIHYKMDELEKKIQNEVLKTEDIEKKLKEAEQREEALIKRITEKDKTITKMNGVIEAYEKAIAELIAEKEQIIQNHEKQLGEVKADRDSNYHHLTSLETTFSDLHVKYEKSKEMTSQLKSNEEKLLAEKRQNFENLMQQEQRYEKMKNHAMQQLEIANKKLETLTKEHAIESTKLKALLKKEEISRASINEQLQQKSRENAELVKICDELINGQGS